MPGDEKKRISLVFRSLRIKNPGPDAVFFIERGLFLFFLLIFAH